VAQEKEGQEKEEIGACPASPRGDMSLGDSSRRTLSRFSFLLFLSSRAHPVRASVVSGYPRRVDVRTTSSARSKRDAVAD